MKPRERNMAVGGLIVGLLIGVLVGALGGGSLFGTAGGDDKETTNKSDDKNEVYYLLTLDQTEQWLMDTLGEKGLDEEMLQTTIAGVRAIEETDDDFRKVAVDNEAMMEDVLVWSQAALNGAEEIKDGEEFEIKDPLTTACLALDDDPWSIDPEYITGVKLYLQIPADEAEKMVPKEWGDPVEPKSDTNLFWIPLQCNPDPNAEDDK